MWLRSWGTGRIAAVTISYWIAAAALLIVRAARGARAAAAAYESSHPGADDYLTGVSITLNTSVAALVVRGPPLVLLTLWLRARRSSGNKPTSG